MAKKAKSTRPAIQVEWTGEKPAFDNTLDEIARQAKFDSPKRCFVIEDLQSKMLRWRAVVVITQGCVEDFIALFREQDFFTSIVPATT